MELSITRWISENRSNDGLLCATLLRVSTEYFCKCRSHTNSILVVNVFIVVVKFEVMKIHCINAFIEACYVVSFAVIMLNTSLHNPSVKEKPSCEHFLKMCKETCQSDLQDQMLKVLRNCSFRLWFVWHCDFDCDFIDIVVLFYMKHIIGVF